MAPTDKSQQPSLAAQARAAIHIKQRRPSQHTSGVPRCGCIASDDILGASAYPIANQSQPLPLHGTGIMSANPEATMGSKCPLSSHVHANPTRELLCDTANSVANESPPMSPSTYELTDSVLHKSQALLRYLSDHQLETECHVNSDCDSEYDYPQLSLCSDVEKINLPELECVEEPKKLQEMLEDMRKMIQAQMADTQEKREKRVQSCYDSGDSNRSMIQEKRDFLLSSTTSLSTDCPCNSLSGTNSSIASPQLELRSSVGQSQCEIPQTDTVTPPRYAASRQALSSRNSYPRRLVQPVSSVAHETCARLRHPSPSTRLSAVSPRLRRVASSGKLLSSSCSSLPLVSPRRLERVTSHKQLGALSPRNSLPSTHVSQTVTVTTSLQSVQGIVTTNLQSSTQTSTSFHM